MSVCSIEARVEKSRCWCEDIEEDLRFLDYDDDMMYMMFGWLVGRVA